MNDPARLAIARDCLRNERAKLLTVKPANRMMYAVSLLVCDDDGRFTRESVEEAGENITVCARLLLLETDLLPETSGLN